MSWLLLLMVLVAGGCMTGAQPPLPQAPGEQPLWIAKVKNSTGHALRLPARTPLRSLGEIVGRESAETRPTVMDLMRDALRRELQQRGFHIRDPEQSDSRFALPGSLEATLSLGRKAGLSGTLLLTEVIRWEADARDFVRVLVDFKLLRIEDGSLLWERRLQRAISTVGAAHLGDAYADAVRRLVRSLFEP